MTEPISADYDRVCNCATWGNAIRCEVHTQEDYDAADRAIGRVPNADYDGPTGKPLWLRWWEFKAWFHRCPECGHGAIAERDAVIAPDEGRA